MIEMLEYFITDLQSKSVFRPVSQLQWTGKSEF